MAILGFISSKSKTKKQSKTAAKKVQQQKLKAKKNSKGCEFC